MVAAEPLAADQEPTLDVALRSYFATPIAVATLPDHHELNAHLRELILSKERETGSVTHSNEGGWQSPADMTDWGGPAFANIVQTGIAIANGMTCDREGGDVDVEWRVNAWANVNRAGHANIFHTHPGCFWSASYYVDDGGVGTDQSLGGEFEIQDPRGVAPAMYAPLLAHKTPGGLSIGVAEVIYPAAGMLMIFPSWLVHGVRLYRGDATRISIAFNLSV